MMRSYNTIVCLVQDVKTNMALDFLLLGSHPVFTHAFKKKGHSMDMKHNNIGQL